MNRKKISLIFICALTLTACSSSYEKKHKTNYEVLYLVLAGYSIGNAQVRYVNNSGSTATLALNSSSSCPNASIVSGTTVTSLGNGSTSSYISAPYSNSSAYGGGSSVYYVQNVTTPACMSAGSLSTAHSSYTLTVAGGSVTVTSP